MCQNYTAIRVLMDVLTTYFWCLSFITESNRGL